jgi:glucose-1-phosphate cytidylyltransferase
LFCGGLGTRMREYSQRLPKPLADVRNHPILWYVMKYYAHYGFNDFILCLGYRADIIQTYFEHYLNRKPGDFHFIDGGKKITLLGEDINNWNITFVDSGVNATIGDRLLSAQPYLGENEWFMANYSDAVTSMHLPELVEYAQQQNKIGCLTAVHPNHSFHTIRMDKQGKVHSVEDLRQAGVLINGGYFVLKQDIFKYLRPNEELVVEAFDRLIQRDQLCAYRHEGTWACVDTFKDRERMEQMMNQGSADWLVWEQNKHEVTRSVLH